ncbi:Membrane-bound lytic murein transglycosylase B precursor [Roseovarius sp. THAF8]|uniref:lytic murein transglycosylase n=1 Tax=Roseovarius sp. THAF8 TaxID=2587846 RepID=UPI001269722C|nr:lytic murein transglycosylase [Roseovarius sp. THAF8]QFT99435.1 Membrane-bound lytic murein transglycosylase B precursor [Roseovarius sp. THAF8]
MIRLLSRLALLLALLTTQPALAQDRAAIERQFQSWLQQDIWPAARAKGVSRATFDNAMGGIRLNWDLPDLVPPGSEATTPKRQTQSEFGAPGRYFRGVSGDAAIGRDLARRHAATLARIEKQTGVPGRILLGIWGRESAYGRAKIPHNVFEVLGTKGFMATRAPYFREELIAALQIAEAGHASGPLRSSWAGALGQPQFMPSNFLQYAADGDGDGRADIWGSVPDTLASIANYLARHGWVAGRDWGFEVTVPASVSCSLEGPDQGRPISEWEAMGITRVSGRPFPDHERSGEGFLMMPAGRNGPAFVVTPNFYVLKDYNMSDLYALYVGHVGDRIQYGVDDFSAPWGAVGKMYRSDIAAMQRSLEGMGHDVGGADGLPGFKTRRSIGRWQVATGRAATCFPEPGMKAQLVR